METTYETAIVIFDESIEKLNSIFDTSLRRWEVSTLKEWVESYESTRFTQISDNSALITSKYNMPFIIIWLQRYTTVTIWREDKPCTNYL